jgi:C4-dicarboxylate transporter DctM subunit
MALFSLLLVFFGLLVIFLPISFSIGLASTISLLVKGTIPLQVVPQKLFIALDSFTLLAIPLFIMVGDIMMEGGISKRLINLANHLVGWMKGGLAYVTITASAFFGAISGSAIATTSAIGGLMYPEMVKSKYNRSFAASIGAISGTLGILIPPSIAFIVFGTSTGTSVTDLFMVGMVAGIMVAILYMMAARLAISKNREGSTEDEPKPAGGGIAKAFLQAFWGLLSPLIILGGIYSGKFTATESAVVAVVYSIFIGMFVYRELTLKKLISILIKSAVSAGAILLLISVAQLFSFILTIENVSSMMKNMLLSAGVNALTFLLLANVLYLILGMLMETIPIIILTSPIFFPIAMQLGIDPVHFGLITVVNLAFGMATPPFGTCVFMANSYSGQPVLDIVKKTGWFYVFGLIGIALVTYAPSLVMWVVR